MFVIVIQFVQQVVNVSRNNFHNGRGCGYGVLWFGSYLEVVVVFSWGLFGGC